MDNSFFDRVLDNIVYGENSGDKAVSPRGAVGRYQLMPAISRAFNVADPTDPVQARAGALGLVSEISERAKKSKPNITQDELERVIYAGYNGGIAAERAVLEGRDPPAKETQNYLKRITQRQLNPQLQAQPQGPVEFSSDVFKKYSQQIQWARTQGFSDQEIMNNIRADEREANQKEAQLAKLAVARQQTFKSVLPTLKLEVAKSANASGKVDLSGVLNKIGELDRDGSLKLKEDIEFFRNQGISDESILIEFIPGLRSAITTVNKRADKSFGKNLIDGVVDGTEMMGLGLGQTFARGVDAITGSNYSPGFRLVAEQEMNDPERVALRDTWGGGIGQAVPDIAAGVATAPVGGGLSTAARLGVQGLLGAGTNMATTPSTSGTDTAIQAATGAIAPVIGEGIGRVATAVSPTVRAGIDAVKSFAQEVSQKPIAQAPGKAFAPVAESFSINFGNTDRLGSIAEHERSQIVSQVLKDRFGLADDVVAPSGVLDLGRRAEIVGSIQQAATKKYDDILAGQKVDKTLLETRLPKIDQLLDDAGIDNSMVEQIQGFLKTPVVRQKVDTAVRPDGSTVAVPKTKVISLNKQNDPEKELLAIQRQIEAAQKQVSGDTDGIRGIQRRVETLERTKRMLTGSDRKLLDETGQSVAKLDDVVSPSAADAARLLAAKNRQIADVGDPTKLSDKQRKYLSRLMQEKDDLEQVVKYKERYKLDDIDEMIKRENEDFARQVDFEFKNGTSRLRELELKKQKVEEKLFTRQQAGIQDVMETVYEPKTSVPMKDLNDILNNVEDELYKMSQSQNVDNIRKRAYEKLQAELKLMFEGSMSKDKKEAFKQADNFYGDYKAFSRVLEKAQDDPLRLGEAKLWEQVVFSSQYKNRALRDKAPLQFIQKPLSAQERRVNLVKDNNGRSQEQSALMDAAIIGAMGGGSLGFVLARANRAMTKRPVNKAISNNSEVLNLLKLNARDLDYPGKSIWDKANNQDLNELSKLMKKRAKAAIKINRTEGDRRVPPSPKIVGGLRIDDKKLLNKAIDDQSEKLALLLELKKSSKQSLRNQVVDEALIELLKQ